MTNPFDFSFVTEADLERANAEFETDCRERHEMGAEKYGEGTFLDKDTIKMMMDEFVDAANYARYTWIKLFLMREQLGAGEVGRALPGKERLGKDAVFNPVARQKEPE